jgi:hypothetical protein
VASELAQVARSIRAILDGRVQLLDYQLRINESASESAAPRDVAESFHPLDFDGSGRGDARAQGHIDRKLKDKYRFDVGSLDKYWLTCVLPKLAPLLAERRAAEQKQQWHITQPFYMAVLRGYQDLEKRAQAEHLDVPQDIRDSVRRFLSALSRSQRASSQPEWRSTLRRAQTATLSAIRQGLSPAPVRLHMFHGENLPSHLIHIESDVEQWERALNKESARARTVSDVFKAFKKADREFEVLLAEHSLDQGLDPKSRAQRRRRAKLALDVAAGAASLASSAELTKFYAHVFNTLLLVVRAHHEQQLRAYLETHPGLSASERARARKRCQPQGLVQETGALTLEYLRTRLPVFTADLTLNNLLARTRRLRHPERS